PRRGPAAGRERETLRPFRLRPAGPQFRTAQGGFQGIGTCSVYLTPGIYWLTAMVAVFDVTPPIVIVMGTASPAATPVGTRTLIWYSPAKPGASPENCTVAGTPPIITVGVDCVCASGLPGAGFPTPGELLTAPRPVQ